MAELVKSYTYGEEIPERVIDSISPLLSYHGVFPDSTFAIEALPVPVIIKSFEL